ncbi:MAG: hypothetical protein JWO67_1532 [Streptosporangiaceae bacterium]|nr:hypothetical protein [Streptosporangiaceae bacterium]
MSPIIDEHSDDQSLMSIANELTAEEGSTARGRARRYPFTVRAVQRHQDAQVLAGGVA